MGHPEKEPQQKPPGQPPALPLPKPALPAEAYFLKIRQGPERAKVPSPREKDRKPIDPQPILQLQINDLNDPAHNYLQSPYLFMWCSILPADENITEPLPKETLSGTKVSSLHRLKDVDNHDGAFFVFGDLSVTIKGQYRLRFSLFEMLKIHCVFIKSIDSDPFYAYSHKDFPGMSESTFLARSFGDQGVKLKTRKEPRTIMRPKPPPRPRSESYTTTAPGYPPPPYVYQHPHAPQAQFQHDPFRNQRLMAHEYHEPAAKRQRTSISMAGGEGYDQEHRFAPRIHTDMRPYSSYPHGYNVPSSQGFRHPGEPYSTTSTVSESYPFGHQRTNSSAASSPYISPQTDSTPFSSISSTHYQMSHSRDPSFHQVHPVDTNQHKHVPYVGYPTPPKHHDQPPHREAMASASHSAAEVLAGMSHSAAAERTPTRSSDVRHGSDREVLSPTPVAGRPVLPPLESMMPASGSGSAPQYRRGTVLPPIEVVTRESDQRPDTLYQSHQIAPSTVSSSTA